MSGARGGSTRRWIGLAAGAAVVLVAIVAIVVASSGGSSKSRATAGAAQGQLVRAAYLTRHAPGFKFIAQVTAGLAGHEVTVSGNGSMSSSGRGSLQMHIAPFTLSEVFAMPDLYLHTGGLPGASALGRTPWVKMRANALVQSLGGSSSIGQGGDPTQMLDYLRSSGAVTAVGHETVRGVSTTHYHAIVDLLHHPLVSPGMSAADARKNAEVFRRITGRSTLPIDAWVDGGNRVRRLQMALSICTATGRLKETVRMDLYDYGKQPAVKIPPASQVTDVTGRMAAAAASALSHLSCGTA